MRKGSWTPRPWRFDGRIAITATGSVDTWDGPVQGSIAHVEDTYQNDGEGRSWSCRGSREANGHLIAAAPDLYEALEVALPWLLSAGLAETMEPVVKARAALAKAQGGPDE